MRLERSAQNLAASVFGQTVSVLFSFATRMVFVRTLAQEYLGIEGLFSSVLLVLSLAELGIGPAIVYSLYEPLAHKNEGKVRSLMRLYRNAYWTVGSVVAVLGLLISFKLHWFIKTPPDIANLQLIFLAFVLNSALSYFFSYKGSLIAADQKNYVVVLNQYGWNVLMCIGQMAVLWIFHSYWLFLGCMLVATLSQNIMISAISNRMYPYQLEGRVDKLDKKTLSEIKKNTTALVIHSLAGVASTPVTNMILSTFVGLTVVAVYANYLLVTRALERLVSQVFRAITAPVGNLGVTESDDRKHEIFRISFYMNAFFAAITAVPLIVVFEDTMRLFFGDKYVFAFTIEVLIVILFYTKQIRAAALSFTSAFGLYWFTRWKAVAEAITLIALSFILVHAYSISGIMVANIASCIFISATIEGYMLYKHGLRRSSIPYFKRMTLYFVLTVALGVIVVSACSFIPGSSIYSLLAKGTLSLFMSIVGFIAMTFWLPEFSATIPFARRFVRLVLRRRRS